jgi:hypothetical protein
VRDLPALQRVAELVNQRNLIDATIGEITGRPVVAGHLGEWIAAAIFDLDLEVSAVAKAIDGRFASGPLAGATVNVKWYGKREGLLDMVEDEQLDFYLVLTGARRPAASSRDSSRPLAIDAVYLFEAASLLNAVSHRGVRIGVATSVIASLWEAAEIFPVQRNFTIPVTREMREALAIFTTNASET